MSALTITAAITDSTIDLTRRADNIAVTTAAGNVDARIVSIGTSEEEHVFSTDIGNAGQMYMRNLDLTNYVEWGPTTGAYPFKLNPGATGSKGGPPTLLQLAPGATSIFLRANTAACRVEIYVHEA